jgi:hypothetical protein
MQTEIGSFSLQTGPNKRTGATSMILAIMVPWERYGDRVVDYQKGVTCPSLPYRIPPSHQTNT